MRKRHHIFRKQFQSINLLPFDRKNIQISLKRLSLLYVYMYQVYDFAPNIR